MPRKKSNGGTSKAIPLTVGRYVDRVQTLRSERESAIDKLRDVVDRRFRERERKLLERVSEDKRMTAQAALEAAEEQRRAVRAGPQTEIRAEPPV